MTRLLTLIAQVLCCAALTLGCGDSSDNGFPGISGNFACIDEVPCNALTSGGSADESVVYCIDPLGDNCYWEFGGQRANCGSCVDQAAVDRCLDQAATFCEGGSGDGEMPGDGEMDGPIEGDFGTLTLSGPDTAEIGTTFEAISVSSVVLSPMDETVRWESEAAGDAAFGVSLRAGEAIFFSFVALVLNPPAVRLFSYQELCDGRCSGTRLDAEARTVTFENATIAPIVEAGSSATAPITLNGTLSWE